MEQGGCFLAPARHPGSLRMAHIPYHPPVKRSVEIAGHKTSISLEPLFWDMLRDAALREGVPINAIVARIDSERIASPTPPGLAGAIRIWLVAAGSGQVAEGAGAA